MPIFEYSCRGCGHQFELIVRANDEPACPSCGKTNLEKLQSLFAVSSEATRQSSLAGARVKAKKTQRDKAIADMEHEREHRH